MFPHAIRRRGHGLVVDEVAVFEVRLEGIEFGIGDGLGDEFPTEGTTESHRDRSAVERVVKEDVLDDRDTVVDVTGDGVVEREVVFEVHCVMCCVI